MEGLEGTDRENDPVVSYPKGKLPCGEEKMTLWLVTRR